MVSVPLWVLIASVLGEAVIFFIFYSRRRKRGYVNNRDKVLQSISVIHKEVATLKHRVELNEREK